MGSLRFGALVSDFLVSFRLEYRRLNFFDGIHILSRLFINGKFILLISKLVTPFPHCPGRGSIFHWGAPRCHWGATRVHCADHEIGVNQKCKIWSGLKFQL